MKNSYKAFVAFEIIISLVITNALLIFGSIISLGVLFPVLVTSVMNYIKRAYTYREYEGMIFTFFKFIKGNIIRTFKVIYPIWLIIIFLIINLVFINNVMFDTLSGTLVVLIYVLQLFVLYELVAIMLHMSIILTNKEEVELKKVFQEAFLLVNTHPIRSIFSVLSFTIIGITTLFNIDYLYMVFIPFALFSFYIVNSPIIEEHKKNRVR